MNNKTFFYCRVSSKSQSLERQLAVARELGIDDREIIVDKESGKNFERAGYLALRNSMLRSGDTLIVKSLDRLSRNKADIKSELEYYKANGIRLKVIDLPTTMIDYPEGQEWVLEMVNNILIEVLGTIAEQERETIRTRQAEGIAVSQQNGVVFGRPKATKPENWDSVIQEWKAGKISAVSAYTQLNLSKPTFYRLVKAYEEQGA